MVQKKLAYPNRYLDELVQSTTVDCVAGSRVVFPDMTTRIPLFFSINQAEFTKLFSTLMFGADLAYPDEAIDINMLFLQLVDCDAMSICQAIIDCIENDADTRAALSEYFITQEGGGFTSAEDFDTRENPLEQSFLDQNLIPAGWTCDEDHAFGLAKGVITDIHNAALGVLNQIEVATNVVEMLGEFVDNVEIVSWSVGIAVELFNWVQNELAPNYEASWGQTASQDELFCGLYCEILPTCELTFQMLDDFYRSFLPSTPADLLNFQTILDWAIDLDLQQDLATVAVWHWVALQALKFRSRFGINFTAGYRSLEESIIAASNDTDGDWINCPACPTTWCYETLPANFQSDGWTILPQSGTGDPQGEFAACGVQTNQNVDGSGNNHEDAHIENLIAATNFTRVDIHFNVVEVGDVQAFASLWLDDTVVENWDDETVNVLGDNVISWVGDVSGVTDIRVRLEMSVNEPPASQGDACITKIRMQGNGDNPFGADNC